MAKRCVNGHYYDGDKFAICPYCGAGDEDSSSSIPPTVGVSSGSSNDIYSSSSMGGEDMETVRLNQPDSGFGGYSAPAASEVDNEATIPLAYQKPVQSEPAPAPAPEPVPAPAPAPAPAPVNYNDLVSNAPAVTDVPDDEKTVRLTSANLPTEPTVGWLIAVSGAYFGECFELKAGKNFIGRDPDMDIVLASDKTVSRKRHAIVLYDPHSRIFVAQPGESRELFYINDKVVLRNEQLNIYDKLLIGKTELVFFPLCGEKFAWEDVKED